MPITLYELNIILILISIYLVTTATGFVVLYKLQYQNLKSNTTDTNLITKLSITILFLNLAGVPPLPGFFIKFYLLLFFLKKSNFIINIILVTVNFTIFYLYIQFYKYIQVYTKARGLNIPATVLMFSLFFFILTLNFYP